MIPESIRNVFTLYSFFILVSVALVIQAVGRAIPRYVVGSWDARLQAGVWIAISAVFSYYTYLYHRAREEKRSKQADEYREMLLAFTFGLAFLWLLPYALLYYGW
jgi:hypothetical protein